LSSFRQDGFLTFERFCAGIKIAILRQEAAERKKTLEESNNNGGGSNDNGNNNNYANIANGNGSSNSEFSVSATTFFLQNFQRVADFSIFFWCSLHVFLYRG
jgi:hypothetical protein